MDRRFVKAGSCRVEQRDSEPAKIRGLAAVYYREDDPGTEFRLFDNVVERIRPGAFAGAIAGDDDVRALFNHDPDNILGRNLSGTLQLRETSDGLVYDITPPESEMSRHIMSSIQRGDISGSSFAFQVTEEEWRSEGRLEVREIRKVKLFDVGPVTYPAYSATSANVRERFMAECRASRERWHEEFQREQEREDEQAAAEAQAERDRLDLMIAIEEQL